MRRRILCCMRCSGTHPSRSQQNVSRASRSVCTGPPTAQPPSSTLSSGSRTERMQSRERGALSARAIGEGTAALGGGVHDMDLFQIQLRCAGLKQFLCRVSDTESNVGLVSTSLKQFEVGSYESHCNVTRELLKMIQKLQDCKSWHPVSKGSTRFTAPLCRRFASPQ